MNDRDGDGLGWAARARIHGVYPALLSGPISRGALLVATAHRVLSSDSPNAEFHAWLRFFVEEWGMS